MNAPRTADGFCDKIIRILGDGKRLKSPPVDLLVAHLVKRGRIAYWPERDLLIGLCSNGQNVVLAGLIEHSPATVKEPTNG